MSEHILEENTLVVSDRNLEGYARYLTKDGDIAARKKQVVDFCNVPGGNVLILGSGKNNATAEIQKELAGRNVHLVSLDYVYARPGIDEHNNEISLDTTIEPSLFDKIVRGAKNHPAILRTDMMVGADWNNLPFNNVLHRIVSVASFPFWADSPEEIRHVMDEITKASKDGCRWWFYGPQGSPQMLRAFKDELKSHQWEYDTSKFIYKQYEVSSAGNEKIHGATYVGQAELHK